MEQTPFSFIKQEKIFRFILEDFWQHFFFVFFFLQVRFSSPLFIVSFFLVIRQMKKTQMNKTLN